MLHIETKENYTLCTPKSSEFSFNDLYEEIKLIDSKAHIIVNLDNSGANLETVVQFTDFATLKREQHTSFVLILKGLDIDAIPDEINVVPTMEEALDVLELDAIERDLMGF